jgi:hypothetical protein
MDNETKCKPLQTSQKSFYLPRVLLHTVKLLHRISATVQESKQQAQGGASGYQNLRGRNTPQHCSFEQVRQPKKKADETFTG